MIRIALALALATWPVGIWAAACCAGGGPKSFISLARLQAYEIGISSTVRDVYGEFDLHGELGETPKNQTYSLLLGAGARLTQDLQWVATVPLVHQVNRFGRSDTTESGLGEILTSLDYVLLESLFSDEWYPTLSVYAGAKLPTGVGNSLWEPFVGLTAKKIFGPLTLSLRSGFTGRLIRQGFDRGDMVDLVESASYSFNERLSLAVGSTQAWTFNDRLHGQIKTDSATRVATVFLSPTYYVDRYWSVAAGLEAALPFAKTGVNAQASRVFSLTTKYGFF